MTLLLMLRNHAYVKEKSKIPVSVSWDGGVEKYSGLLDVGLAAQYVGKPSNGWYCQY
jgi:hypothetical protein